MTSSKRPTACCCLSSSPQLACSSVLSASLPVQFTPNLHAAALQSLPAATQHCRSLRRTSSTSGMPIFFLSASTSAAYFLIAASSPVSGRLMLCGTVCVGGACMSGSMAGRVAKALCHTRQSRRQCGALQPPRPAVAAPAALSASQCMTVALHCHSTAECHPTAVHGSCQRTCRPCISCWYCCCDSRNAASTSSSATVWRPERREQLAGEGKHAGLHGTVLSSGSTRQAASDGAGASSAAARTLRCGLRGRGKAPSDLLRLRQHTGAGGGLRGARGGARFTTRGWRPRPRRGARGETSRRLLGAWRRLQGRRSVCQRGNGAAHWPWGRQGALLPPAQGCVGANPGPWGWQSPHPAAQLPHQPLGGRPQAIRQHSGSGRATQAASVQPRDPAAPTDCRGQRAGRGGSPGNSHGALCMGARPPFFQAFAARSPRPPHPRQPRSTCKQPIGRPAAPAQPTERPTTAQGRAPRDPRSRSRPWRPLPAALPPP